MNRMQTCAIAVAVLLSRTAAAQTPTFTPRTAATPETGPYVSLGVGGQPITRSFGSTGSFTSFNETGRYNVLQNIGAGVLLDIGGGYRFTKHLSVGVSLWGVRSKSAAAAAASVPDPVFIGVFKTAAAVGGNELKQTTGGANLFLSYSLPVTDRVDLAVSLGPTIVMTKLDVATVSVDPNTQAVTMSSVSQSKTGAKAGNAGIDLTYRVGNTYGVGVFARYAGGELDLPAVPKLKVGSAQVGGLIRLRF